MAVGPGRPIDPIFAKPRNSFGNQYLSFTESGTRAYTDFANRWAAGAKGRRAPNYEAVRTER
jgi:hypothetical protein